MNRAQIVRVRPVTPPGPAVECLLGDGSPEAVGTGGWAFVSRPRRKGFTEWNGNDPYVLQIPVLLDGFATDTSVEPSIEALRRIMRNPVGGRGEPPVVRVEGATIPLPQLRWVLNEMAPGAVVRRADGARVRAFYTLTFLEYEAADILVAARPTPATAARGRQGAPAASGTGRGTRTARTYTVRAGDTLGTIAARQLGDARRYREIATLNKIRDPNRIRVGQVLRLP